MPKKKSNNGKIGAGFEAQLETVCLQYQARGLLRLKKVEPPTRIAGGRIIFLENPFLDFVGSWTERAGRAVFFEAKKTATPKLPMDGDAGLTRKQVNALRNWHNAGAVAFVLWHYQDTVRLLTAPLVMGILCTRKHAKLEDCAVVPPGDGFVKFDFLRNMRIIW